MKLVYLIINQELCPWRMGQLTGQLDLRCGQVAKRVSSSQAECVQMDRSSDGTSSAPKGNVRPSLTDSLGHTLSSYGGWGSLLLFSFSKRKELSGQNRYHLTVPRFLTKTKLLFKTSSELGILSRKTTSHKKNEYTYLYYTHTLTLSSLLSLTKASSLWNVSLSANYYEIEVLRTTALTRIFTEVIHWTMKV